MTIEETLGRVARAKENVVMAQKSLKELWADWMERRQNDIANLRGGTVGVFDAPSPEQFLDRIIDRLELALHDVKTVRDNLGYSHDRK